MCMNFSWNIKLIYSDQGKIHPVYYVLARNNLLLESANQLNRVKFVYWISI